MQTPTIPRATFFLIVAETEADPRTVQKAFRGHRIKGPVGERIARAFKRHGVKPANGDTRKGG